MFPIGPLWEVSLNALAVLEACDYHVRRQILYLPGHLLGIVEFYNHEASGEFPHIAIDVGGFGKVCVGQVAGQPGGVALNGFGVAKGDETEFPWKAIQAPVDPFCPPQIQVDEARREVRERAGDLLCRVG